MEPKLNFQNSENENLSTIDIDLKHNVSDALIWDGSPRNCLSVFNKCEMSPINYNFCNENSQDTITKKDNLITGKTCDWESVCWANVYINMQLVKISAGFSNEFSKEILEYMGILHNDLLPAINNSNIKKAAITIQKFMQLFLNKKYDEYDSVKLLEGWYPKERKEQIRFMNGIYTSADLNELEELSIKLSNQEHNNEKVFCFYCKTLFVNTVSVMNHYINCIEFCLTHNDFFILLSKPSDLNNVSVEYQKFLKKCIFNLPESHFSLLEKTKKNSTSLITEMSLFIGGISYLTTNHQPLLVERFMLSKWGVYWTILHKLITWRALFCPFLSKIIVPYYWQPFANS